MGKKIGCKNCGSRNYTFEKVVKKDKVKFFRVCSDCGKLQRVYPKRLAFYMYSKLCKYEAAKECQGLPANQDYAKILFKAEDRLKEEYRYLYNNLILFFDYIFNNDKIEIMRKIVLINIMEIMKNHKSPLQENDCEIIIEELLKTLEVD